MRAILGLTLLAVGLLGVAGDILFRRAGAAAGAGEAALARTVHASLAPRVPDVLPEPAVAHPSPWPEVVAVREPSATAPPRSPLTHSLPEPDLERRIEELEWQLRELNLCFENRRHADGTGLPWMPGEPRLLQRGEESYQVMWLQDRLRQLGEYFEEAHGVFDQTTLGAVVAFQQRQQLLVDGIVGPETRGRIYALLRP